MEKSQNKLKRKIQASEKHVCTFCSKTFKRKEHCVRHKRGRHTQEKPFECRYCPKKYGRLDVVVRHEKIAHEGQYFRRPDRYVALPLIHQDSPATTLGPRTDKQSPWEAQLEEDSSSSPPGEHRVAIYIPATPPSDREENILSSPAVNHAMPAYLSTAAPLPPNPDERIQRAIDMLDFTTLHAEALSANHIITPTGTLPPEKELIQSDFRFEGGQETILSGAGDWEICNASSTDDLYLPLGLMFDPLWDPVMTKKAAVTAYAIDLHQEILFRSEYVNAESACLTFG